MQLLTLGVLLETWLIGMTIGSSSDFIGFMELKQHHKDEWTETHNWFRRNVNNPEAANMRLMTWDDELADLAKRAVRNCTFNHTTSKDLRTSAFKQAGENLYTGSHFRFSKIMAQHGVTKQWYDEVQYYNYASRTCKTGKICGHYTQIIWAETYKVGCAIGDCKKVEYGYSPYLVACSYGPAGNVRIYNHALSPYKSGDSCSKCHSSDQCIDQLCINTARDVQLTTTTLSTTTDGGMRSATNNLSVLNCFALSSLWVILFG